MNFLGRLYILPIVVGLKVYRESDAGYRAFLPARTSKIFTIKELLQCDILLQPNKSGNPAVDVVIGLEMERDCYLLSFSCVYLG